MTPTQLSILQHTLGLDDHGRQKHERNRFVTGEGGTDHADCLALVDRGYMTRRKAIALFGGDDLFEATAEGRKAAIAASPPPPTLSAGQQRYRAYLNADSSLSFIDWLRMKSSARRRTAEGGIL